MVSPVTPEKPSADPAGYGRARLWLGISAVGTIVTLACAALLVGLPSRGGIAGIPLILAFIGLYALVQFPFDLLGGYVLPRRFGRAHPRLGTFFVRLLRGVLIQSTLLAAVGLALLAGAGLAGIVGVIATGVGLSMLLLVLRGPLARLVAPLVRRRPEVVSTGPVPVEVLESEDEGFTGGVLGVLRPRRNLLPVHWREALGHNGLELAMQRRDAAIESGAWWRGRVAALLFVWTGLAASAVCVGDPAIRTATGIIELSLLFTLWSFLGLLVLPTLSRRGVAEIDRRVLRKGVAPDAMATTIAAMDVLQDDEPSRLPLVEAIFHPIPSVRARLEDTGRAGGPGYWDVARTMVFLSASGFGLLGRAVHCNCGRPALWVFLPLD